MRRERVGNNEDEMKNILVLVLKCMKIQKKIKRRRKKEGIAVELNGKRER